MLTDAEKRCFIEDGYLRVGNVFSSSVARDLADRVWRRLGENPDYPSDRLRAHPQLEEIIEDGPVEALVPPRLVAVVDALVGRDRWWTRRGYGWSIIRLPAQPATLWSLPQGGWHVDGTQFVHHVDSQELGLVGLEMLTDAPADGGATLVRPGSHRAVARYLHAAGSSGVNYPQLRSFAEALQGHEAVAVPGRAGDVLLMHPHLVHARSMNVRPGPRIAANREFHLRAPMQVHHPGAGGFSPVEQAIHDALFTGPADGR